MPSSRAARTGKSGEMVLDCLAVSPFHTVTPVANIVLRLWAAVCWSESATDGCAAAAGAAWVKAAVDARARGAVSASAHTFPVFPGHRAVHPADVRPAPRARYLCERLRSRGMHRRRDAVRPQTVRRCHRRFQSRREGSAVRPPPGSSRVLTARLPDEYDERRLAPVGGPAPPKGSGRGNRRGHGRCGRSAPEWGP